MNIDTDWHTTWCMSESSEARGDALAAVAYLARSENRVGVLATLTEETTKPGQPTPGYPRRELAERTGTARTTLGRILTEFEERGWAERDVDGAYVATPLGQHVAVAFEPLLESMTTITSLDDAVRVLPPGELAIGPNDEIALGHRHFKDATVVSPANWDPTDTQRYYAELLDDAETFHGFVYVGPSQEIMDAFRAGIEEGRLSIDAVFSKPIVDRFRENPVVGPDQSDLATDDVRMYCYDGHLSCNLWVVDDTVAIENGQVPGVQPGTIVETTSDAVRRWALELVDEYIETSEQVAPAELG